MGVGLGEAGERAEMGLPGRPSPSHYTVPYDQVRIILTWRPDVSCGRVTIEMWRLSVSNKNVLDGQEMESGGLSPRSLLEMMEYSSQQILSLYQIN